MLVLDGCSLPLNLLTAHCLLCLRLQAPTANLFSSIQLPDAMLGGAAAGGPGTTSHGGAGDSGDSSGGGGGSGGGSKKSAEQRAAAVQEKNRRAQKRFRERQVGASGTLPAPGLGGYPASFTVCTST